MNKKAIILTGDLAQDHEFIYPFYRLLEERIDVDVCTPEGKPVVGILGTRLPPNKNHPVKSISEISVDEYDLLVLPGGVKAMEKLRLEKKFINFVKKYCQKDKLVACICSGIQMMISANTIENRTVSGYYSLQIDIENARATYKDLEVVEDKNYVTTAHYKDMGPWMATVVRKLRDET
jgi:protease I